MDFKKGVQKVQRVQRVQRVVDCPAGNAYKISVTGFALVSPVPHDEEQKGGCEKMFNHFFTAPFPLRL